MESAGELITQQSAKIIPLPQAIIWHEMAQQILAMACSRAIKLGVLTEEVCYHVRLEAKRLDTFQVRRLTEMVLDKMEKNDDTGDLAG